MFSYLAYQRLVLAIVLSCQDFLTSLVSTLRTLDWWRKSVSRIWAETPLATSRGAQDILGLGTTTLVVSSELVTRH